MPEDSGKLITSAGKPVDFTPGTSAGCNFNPAADPAWIHSEWFREWLELAENYQKPSYFK